MFYLEKVIAVIADPVCMEEVKELGRVLEDSGLAFACMSLEEYQDQQMEDGCFQPAYFSGGMSCLWLADHEMVVNRLCQDGQAVLALLHERNRQQDLTAALYACEKPGELDDDFMEKVYRRCLGLPWDILETQRCLVRETVPEDAEAFFGIYGEESVTRYTDGLFPELEQEKRYIEDYIEKVYRFYNFGVWTILLKDTGEVIGRAGFSFREGFEEPELGYVIGLPWQGQGYAGEVCKEILQFGFGELEFNGVHAFIRPGNAASLGLCRKLGMEPDGDALIGGVKHVCMRIDRDCKSKG